MSPSSSRPAAGPAAVRADRRASAPVADPVSRLAAALLAVLALVALLPGDARAQATWAPEDRATIHPGVQTFSGGQCTANFVFTGADGEVYLGSAAHCSGTDGNTAVDGCRAGTHPVGSRVDVDGAAHPAVLVYSSWVTMQDRGETDRDLCLYNDFALLRIDARDRGRVNPTVPFYGGPEGIVDRTSAGDDVFSYGNSSLRFGVSSLRPKRGRSLGQAGGGWTHDVYTATPGISGDSGSAFLDRSGQAFGVLSTLEAAPQTGSNGVSDLSRALAYAAAHGGIEAALARGTRRFDAQAVPVDPGGQPPPEDEVVRLSGPTRIETAIAVSRNLHADDSAAAVVLARSDDFADALAATPLAAGAAAPLLLSPQPALHEGTRREIDRVLRPGGRVELLGGPAALGPAVEAELRGAGYDVKRLSGPTRVETAIAVAQQTAPAPREILLADGLRFPDALVAGPAAHLAGGVVILTNGAAPHPSVDAYLRAHDDAEVVTIGRTAAQAYPGRRTHAADDDAGTSVAVAQAYAQDAEAVGIARVDVFADALAGGAHIARGEGPVLLSDRDRLPSAVAEHLRAHAEQLATAVLYGGTGALSERVEQEVRDAIR